MNHESPQLHDYGPSVDAAPEGPFKPTVMEERIARFKFSESVGRQTLRQQPELFETLHVGTWESFAIFVSDFVEESGLVEGIAKLPGIYSQLITVDRRRVADYLRANLLVLPVGETVWVFDAIDVVKTTVAEKQRRADNG